MKYIDLIEVFTPYADKEVDALIVPSLNEISFWLDEGETEIISIEAHE